MCPIIAAWYLHRFFVCELLSGLHTRFYYETETSFLSPSLLDYKSREWHESVKAWRKAFQRLAYWLLTIANDIIHFKIWLHVEQKTFEDKCRNSRRCHGGNKTGRSKIKYHSGWKKPKMSYHLFNYFSEVIFKLKWSFLRQWPFFVKWMGFF